MSNRTIHGMGLGQSDEWYTPPEMLDAIGLEYDLDPCSPGPHHWVPATHVFTKFDDGLSLQWDGRVFMNPPFGGRHGQVPWLKRFLAHGNGIAVVRAYTSADWFHELAVCADAMLFPRGKTRFIKPDGSRGSCPSTGVVLLAMGRPSLHALEDSGLGMFTKDWRA